MILEKMKEENDALIYSIIGKYKYYYPQEDLYQVAQIGLIEAYNNYKSDKNTKFSSYAYFYIKGEVQKYIRNTNMFKVSKEMVKLNKSIIKAREVLTNKLNKEVTDKEVADFLNISIDMINDASCCNSFITSLDNTLDEDGYTIYDTIGKVDRKLEADILDLKCEIEKLNDYDKKIIIERYANDLSQKEISDMLGISQVQVSRKEKEILTKLRTRLS